MNDSAASVASSFRPFWMNEAMKHEDPDTPQPLNAQINTDVCIIGGGYTGLWTAIELKTREPNLDVVVLEKEICGYGASGSNGGCALTLAPKFLSLCKYFGLEEAKRIVMGSETAVEEIKQFTDEHGIDCEFRVDGAQFIATNEAQVGAMDAVIEALESEGINSWRKQPLDEARASSGTSMLRESYFSPVAGSLQPALLVRGLARVARNKGVRIFEKTPMTSLIDKNEAPKVVTQFGEVTAKKVVLAMNAWMASSFKQFSRSIVVVSSDMAITEPIPELLDELRLNHGATICDSRTFVHYFHTTQDGRLLFGKGGNTFAFGSKMIDTFFEPSRYGSQLNEAIQSFFPSMSGTKLEQVWNGGSDRSTTGFPFFGNLNGHPNIHYGFGYSGNGVIQCRLGGKILASLCLDQDDEWSRSGFVGGPRGQFPPEPFRWIGSLAVRNAIRRKELAEDRAQRPRAFDSYLARFAKSAGKTDQ